MSKTKVSKNAFRRQQKKLKKDVCWPHPSARSAPVAKSKNQETPTPASAQPAVSEPADQAGDLLDGANTEPAAAVDATVAEAHEADDTFDFEHLPEFEKVFQRFQDSRQAASIPRQQEKEQVIWEEDNEEWKKF